MGHPEASQQIVPYNDVSSAKSLTVELRPAANHLYTLWGTPDVMITGADDVPLNYY